MNKIIDLAEVITIDDERLIRYEGNSAYVRNYGDDGFRFHVNASFLSDWFPTIEACIIAAIEYLFSNASALILLEKFICLTITSPWKFKHSRGRMTILTPSGHVAVVDASLNIIHATDDDIQCSIYGFIESVKPFRSAPNHYIY